MIEVELPDGTIAEFPDGTSQDVMRDALRKRFGKPEATKPAGLGWRDDGQTNVVEQVGSGTSEGVADILGAPVDMLTSGINGILGGVNKVAGTEIPGIQNPVGGSAYMRDKLSPFIAEDQPQSAAQRYGRSVGREVGASAIPGGAAVSRVAAPANALAQIGASSVLSGIGSQAGRDIAPGNALAEVAGGMLGGAIPGIAYAARSGPQAPTTEALRDQAGALYEKGRARPGASHSDVDALRAETMDYLRQQNLITPTGRNLADGNVKKFIDVLGDFEAPDTSAAYKVDDAGRLTDAAHEAVDAWLEQQIRSRTPLSLEQQRMMDRSFAANADSSDEMSALIRQSLAPSPQDMIAYRGDVTGQFDPNAGPVSYSLSRDTARTFGTGPDVQGENVRRVVIPAGTPVASPRSGISGGEVIADAGLLRDEAMTPGDMQSIREFLKGAASSSDSNERRVGKQLLEKFDDWRGQRVPEFKEADRLYSRAKRAEDVDFRIEKAERRADSTGTGGNRVNAARQNIRQILDNPKARRGYSPDELIAMERIVRGTPVTNALRLGGRLSPTSGALPLIGNIVGSGVNPLAGAAMMGITQGMKTGAEALTNRQINALSGLIRNGAPLAVKSLTEAERAALATLAIRSATVAQ